MAYKKYEILKTIFQRLKILHFMYFVFVIGVFIIIIVIRQGFICDL
jgi:hypothetical protein